MLLFLFNSFMVDPFDRIDAFHIRPCGLRIGPAPDPWARPDPVGHHRGFDLPLVTLLVPLFEIMRALGLLNTWIALILPYTV